MEGRWWLGLAGTETLFETGWSGFVEEEFEINREDRVANGDLVIDTIAIKKRFTITYSALTQTTLDALMTEYDRGVILSFIVEEEDLTTSTYSVKFRPFKRLRLVAMDEWLWKGVSFILEEV